MARVDHPKNRIGKIIYEKLRDINIEKDLKRAGLSLYGITTGRNRVRFKELLGERKRWKDITAASMGGRAYRMIT